MIAYSFLLANSALQKVISDRGKRVSDILAFEFTPNQTRINPEGTPKVLRRYYEGTTEVLPRNLPGPADALADAFIVKAKRRNGVKSLGMLVPGFV